MACSFCLKKKHNGLPPFEAGAPYNESMLLLTLRTLNYFYHFLHVFPSLTVSQRQAAVCQSLENSLAFLVGKELNSAASAFMDRVSYLIVCAAPSGFSLLVSGAHHKSLDCS